MADFLDHVITRALGSAPTIRPRPPALFESPQVPEGYQPADEPVTGTSRLTRPRPALPAAETPSTAGNPSTDEEPRPQLEPVYPRASGPDRTVPGPTTSGPVAPGSADSGSGISGATADPVVPGRSAPEPVVPDVAGPAVAVPGPPRRHAATPPVAPEVVERTRVVTVPAVLPPAVVPPPRPDDRRASPPGALSPSAPARPRDDQQAPLLDVRQAEPVLLPAAVRGRARTPDTHPAAPPVTPLVPPASRRETQQALTSRAAEVTAAPPAPTVQVTIGRVEVRAATSREPARHQRQQPAVMSLDEYLRQCAGGG